MKFPFPVSCHQRISVKIREVLANQYPRAHMGTPEIQGTIATIGLSGAYCSVAAPGAGGTEQRSSEMLLSRSACMIDHVIPPNLCFCSTPHTQYPHRPSTT